MTNTAASASRDTATGPAHRLGPALQPTSTPPTPSPGLRVRLSAAGPELWRVLNMSGYVIGHLQRADHPLGARWHARRYTAAAGGFRTIGEFWSVDEAVSALSSG